MKPSKPDPKHLPTWIFLGAMECIQNHQTPSSLTLYDEISWEFMESAVFLALKFLVKIFGWLIKVQFTEIFWCISHWIFEIHDNTLVLVIWLCIRVCSEHHVSDDYQIQKKKCSTCSSSHRSFFESVWSLDFLDTICFGCSSASSFPRFFDDRLSMCSASCRQRQFRQVSLLEALQCHMRRNSNFMHSAWHFILSVVLLLIECLITFFVCLPQNRFALAGYSNVKRKWFYNLFGWWLRHPSHSQPQGANNILVFIRPESSLSVTWNLFVVHLVRTNPNQSEYYYMLNRSIAR